jgi:nucleotide-binding universal stress UspA family protein
VVLICYDGSPDARAAIEQAGALLPGHDATVLTVWEPFVDVLARTPTGFGLPGGALEISQVDEATEQAALEQAAEGAKLAGSVGLAAQARACPKRTNVAAAILTIADEIGADAIVMGSRGLTGVKSLLLGSVSHAVIQHANRAVVVVPSSSVAAARERALRDD